MKTLQTLAFREVGGGILNLIVIQAENRRKIRVAPGVTPT
jgi:hypothetical protein